MQNRKRIAIQLFGHLRTFKHTYESLYNNVIIPNEEDGYIIDIFIHTWNEKNHSTIVWHNQDGAFVDKELKGEDIELIKKLYNPKKLLIEKQLDCDEQIIIEKVAFAKRSIKGCLNASYTIYKTNELRKEYEKEKNIKYNWVINTRPDVVFIKKFKIDRILQIYDQYKLEIEPNALFHASNPFGRGSDVEEPRLLAGSDIIYFARPENMNKATEMYLSWHDRIDIDNFYCFEVWWMDFWKAQGLKPLAINYKHGPDFDILRDKTTTERIQQIFSQEFFKQKANEKQKLKQKTSQRKILKKIIQYFHL